MLSGMMLYLQKTRPETHSTAFDEKSKQFLSKNCWHEKMWSTNHLKYSLERPKISKPIKLKPKSFGPKKFLSEKKIKRKIYEVKKIRITNCRIKLKREKLLQWNCMLLKHLKQLREKCLQQKKTILSRQNKQTNTKPTNFFCNRFGISCLKKNRSC